MSEKMHFHIRWMIRRDMPRVLAIENASFEFPWNENQFVRCMRQRNSIGMVAEERDGLVIGFFLIELHKGRVHLLNMAVLPECRRHGIGTAMVEKLKGKLSYSGRSRIMLEVRETNMAGQMFFKANGFKAISILKEFFDDANEDAYLMQYRYLPTEEDLRASGYANAAVVL